MSSKINKNKHKNINSITITESNQLFQLTQNQVKNVKSFFFNNLIIDNKFLKHLMKLSLDYLDSFYFIECTFYNLNVLSAVVYSKNAGFIRCGLSLEEIEIMLDWIKDWKKMDILDLSGNKLGRKPIEFFKYLNWNIWCGIFINKFILSDNGFSAEFKVRMLEHNEWFKSFNDISL